MNDNGVSGTYSKKKGSDLSRSRGNGRCNWGK